MTERALAGQPLPMGLAPGPAAFEESSEFTQLFQENYAFVWRSLLHFGLSEGSADDAAQEVFLVVYRRLGQFDRQLSFRGWIYGIARHVASATRRGETRARERAARSAEETLESVQNIDAGEQLDARRRVEAVERALRRLPDEQREVFVLAEIEGFPVPEIVETLGVKLNTVYSRLRLARSRFEREMNSTRANGTRT